VALPRPKPLVVTMRLMSTAGIRARRCRTRRIIEGTGEALGFLDPQLGATGKPIRLRYSTLTQAGSSNPQRRLTALVCCLQVSVGASQLTGPTPFLVPDHQAVTTWNPQAAPLLLPVPKSR
jgi:hypothetical protein